MNKTRTVSVKIRPLTISCRKIHSNHIRITTKSICLKQVRYHISTKRSTQTSKPLSSRLQNIINSSNSSISPIDIINKKFAFAAKQSHPSHNMTSTTQPVAKAQQLWTHASDPITTRTAISLRELYQQQSGPQNPDAKREKELVCNHCLLHNWHCVCDEFPSRQEVTDQLNTLLDVVVYVHTNEVFSLTSSNTARFLPRHGAYSVIMGDYRNEQILINLILSRPRDSVFVLFPSPSSITPLEFTTRFENLSSPSSPQHLYSHYPPLTLEQLRIIRDKNQEIDSRQPLLTTTTTEPLDAHKDDQAQAPPNRKRKAHRKQQHDDSVRLEIISTQQERVNHEHTLNDLIDDRFDVICPTFSSSRDFYQIKDQHYEQYQQQLKIQKSSPIDSSPIDNQPFVKPLVIVLDGTWGNAKTLDRRLNLILNDVFERNQYNEQQLLLEPIPALPTSSLSTTTSTDPTTTTTSPINPTNDASTDDNAKNDDDDDDTTKDLPTYLHNLQVPSGYQVVNPKLYLHRVRVTRAIRGDIGQLRRLQTSERSVTTSAAEINKVLWNQADLNPIADDSAPSTSIGGRVSTLHAFLVLLEELFDLPIINSHRDLDVEQYRSQLTKPQQQIVLDLVQSFATILQAIVIGYHTQHALRKAQLLDPETRQKAKERYQKYLDRLDTEKQIRYTNYKQVKDSKQQQKKQQEQFHVDMTENNNLSNGSDSDEQNNHLKKQRHNIKNNSQDDNQNDHLVSLQPK